MHTLAVCILHALYKVLLTEQVSILSPYSQADGGHWQEGHRGRGGAVLATGQAFSAHCSPLSLLSGLCHMGGSSFSSRLGVTSS